MRLSGMPIATCSCVAGRFTLVMPSVTGCSTWRRGLSSRKKKLPVSALYRYSTVPAPMYPMFCVRRCAAFSISRKIAGSAIVGGPSSKIFWKRRCVEQSRPLSATALPNSSPTICTSRCLACVQSCIMNMGEPGTSALTISKFTLSSSSLSLMRMPLPPPPSDALSMTGYPMRFAAASDSSTVVTIALLKMSSGMVPSSLSTASSPSPDHGIEGTFAVCARMLAAILSPSTDITGAVGPMNWMPRSLSAVGSRGFSDACPQPGHTASTPSRSAMSTIRFTSA